MSARNKGKTRWYQQGVDPVRRGFYECAVQISRSLPCILWSLEWDGIGFLVPCPMIVRQWRGQTLKAFRATVNTQGEAP